MLGHFYFLSSKGYLRKFVSQLRFDGGLMMKLFKVCIEKAAFLGIYPIGSKKDQFNRRNIAFLLLYTIFAAASIAFMVFDANTMLDYEQSFFALLTSAMIAADFYVFIQKSCQIFRLVARVEKLIDNGNLVQNWRESHENNKFYCIIFEQSL